MTDNLALTDCRRKHAHGRHESEIDINRPLVEVYGFFLDLEKSVTGTDATVKSVVKTSQGLLAAGTTFLIRQPVMGKKREQTVRVTAGRRIQTHPVANEPHRPAELSGRLRLIKDVLEAEGHSPSKR